MGTAAVLHQSRVRRYSTRARPVERAPNRSLMMLAAVAAIVLLGIPAIVGVSGLAAESWLGSSIGAGISSAAGDVMTLLGWAKWLAWALAVALVTLGGSGRAA